MTIADRPQLVLCDIEGVLLDVPGERARHAAALQAAVAHVTGVAVRLDAERGHHTDFTLVDDALGQLGLSGTLSERAFELIAGAAAERYRRDCPPRLDMCVRPGVSATLAALRADRRCLLCPCTGMVRDVAVTLIERSGLDGPLRVGFGAYGTFGARRADLVRVARERAGGPLAWPAGLTVVVSRDECALAAAREDGVLCVKVGGSGSTCANAHVALFERLPDVLRTLRVLNDSA